MIFSDLQLHLERVHRELQQLANHPSRRAGQDVVHCAHRARLVCCCLCPVGVFGVLALWWLLAGWGAHVAWYDHCHGRLVMARIDGTRARHKPVVRARYGEPLAISAVHAMATAQAPGGGERRGDALGKR